ncbi:MAG: riboflavin synthase [Acidobacteria bacterium]|nr:riboflavin synthase [Acidobacteriota bacterium]
MFTGIVEEVGKVVELSVTSSGGKIIISTPKLAGTMKMGESLAVNGACLTLTDIRNETVSADISLETLRRTTIGSLRRGDPVNLERALRVGEPLGGHLVLGHIDFVAEVIGFRKEGEAQIMRIAIPSGEERFFVKKGSVAVDGVSLTVSGLSDSYFEVTLIPFTLNETTLGKRKMGDKVNIECDIIGKYVVRFLEGRKEQGLSIDYLMEQGF